MSDADMSQPTPPPRVFGKTNGLVHAVMQMVRASGTLELPGSQVESMIPTFLAHGFEVTHDARRDVFIIKYIAE